MARHLPIVEVERRSSLRGDGSREVPQPADVHGRFARARNVVFVVLIAVYAALPWIRVGGAPAVWLDIQHRRFYLLSATFNAQDTWLLFFLLAGVGLALILLTALAGRVWCAWACPQTVFLEGVFRKIERLIEGPREARIKRNKGPWNADKIARKGAVYAVYLAASLVVAHIFLSYFVSLPEVFRMVRASPAAHPEAFAWMAAVTGATFFNFAFFREQLCVVVCPYGRLQGVLVDTDSLVVGYDAKRGEPRGKARGRERDAAKGDCVDCNRCVVVCPMNIDIRNGLQLDCIGCTACIDACDEVMDKLHRPRGLIRYDSTNGLSGGPKRIMRPRVWLYVGVMAVLIVVDALAFRRRTDFEANVLRLPGAPYTLDDGVVRNAFEVHLVNKRQARTTFAIEPIERPGVTFVVPLATVTLDSLQGVRAPVFISVPRAEFRGDFQARLRVRVLGAGANAGESREVTAPVLGPAPGAAQ
jgi:cytochrome c oxidase accessory protein FixG